MPRDTTVSLATLRALARKIVQRMGTEVDPGISGGDSTPVTIVYRCSECGANGAVTVPWGSHHMLPSGWLTRDAIPSGALPRRTDHIFACSEQCAEKLNTTYPPPKTPKWFGVP